MHAKGIDGGADGAARRAATAENGIIPGKPVGAVVAAANVLRTLHAAERPLNASEVARAAGLHRGTAYNILRTLQTEGFVGYDEATRTLTWRGNGTDNAIPDPADGTVTYQVTVLDTAPEFAQPLTNVATIDSLQTEAVSDTASVAVLAPPQELTPPPTSTITPQTGTGNPGFALMLILLGVAGLTLGIGFITPVPARVRRRDRLG
jgi:hypothetical protein